ATSLSGGRGFERWRLIDDRWRRGDQALSLEGLLERARARSLEGGRVLVQRALDNHPDLAPIAPDALATLRLITMRRPDGAPEPLYAGLRVPGAGAEVDNLSQGGAIADVDLAAGVLAAAEPDAVTTGTLDAHPTTGAS